MGRCGRSVRRGADVAVRCGVMGREMSWAVCGVAEVLGAALAGA